MVVGEDEAGVDFAEAGEGLPLSPRPGFLVIMDVAEGVVCCLVDGEDEEEDLPGEDVDEV